jgi:hypothetical protein
MDFATQFVKNNSDSRVGASAVGAEKGGRLKCQLSPNAAGTAAAKTGQLGAVKDFVV